MNYHMIISEKQKELTKLVKNAVGAAFMKEYSESYSFDFCMFEGSFNAEIKEKMKHETVFETGFIEMNPRCVYTMDFGKMCKELDSNIKKVKEFITMLKKLK